MLSARLCFAYLGDKKGINISQALISYIQTHLFISAPRSNSSFMHCRLLCMCWPLLEEIERWRAVEPEDTAVSSTPMLQLLRRCFRHSRLPFLAARCKQFSPCTTDNNITFVGRISEGKLTTVTSLLVVDGLELDNRHRFNHAMSPTLHASSASSMENAEGGVAGGMTERLRSVASTRATY